MCYIYTMEYYLAIKMNDVVIQANHGIPKKITLN